VIAQVSIYQSQIKVDGGEFVGDQEIIELLTEVLRML